VYLSLEDATSALHWYTVYMQMVSEHLSPQKFDVPIIRRTSISNCMYQFIAGVSI